ncbi:hypothetical protein TNCV_4896091 [Trichonephila clavipes]|uniref:Uncharacterized protein n=1 Tax=Trichonephila clavipes TaxID=2585209 RepID=A0A8X7B9E6_TRICX|nr:hypothetical protein TNCV_4896091 [Trichonephila clavipes]
MKCLRVSVLLDYLTVSSEEFVAVEDDNVCRAPIVADKDILYNMNAKNDDNLAISPRFRNVSIESPLQYKERRCL